MEIHGHAHAHGGRANALNARLGTILGPRPTTTSHLLTCSRCDGQCAQRATSLQIISKSGTDVEKMRAGNVGKMWVSLVSGHDGGPQSPDLDENFGTPYSF